MNPCQSKAGHPGGCISVCQSAGRPAQRLPPPSPPSLSVLTSYRPLIGGWGSRSLPLLPDQSPSRIPLFSSFKYHWSVNHSQIHTLALTLNWVLVCWTSRCQYSSHSTSYNQSIQRYSPRPSQPSERASVSEGT